MDEVMREVALLETLDHPFITRIHESFTENGALHIIMEYCDGGTLQGLLKQMKEEGVELNSVTFNSLIDAAIRCQNLPVAAKLSPKIAP